MSPRISIRLLAGQSDERLLALARDGHERAFEALVHRYRTALLRYLRRAFGLPDPRAEDVLQQALLKAWLALARGAEVRDLRPWLYRIAHNTALNAIRGPGERQLELVDGVLSGYPADESPLERWIDAREALSGVAAVTAGALATGAAVVPEGGHVARKAQAEGASALAGAPSISDSTSGAAGSASQVLLARVDVEGAADRHRLGAARRGSAPSPA